MITLTDDKPDVDRDEAAAPPPQKPAARGERRSRAVRLAAALAGAGIVAGASIPLGDLLPRVGAPIIALAAGILIASARPATKIRDELSMTSRYSLQVAIVLLGSTFSLQEVASVGGASLPVMLGSLASALIAAEVIGRRLGVPVRLKALVGIGTGICGASAIAAVSGPLDAEDHEIRYAVSTIFVFNLIAVIFFPIVGHLLNMSQHSFGLWAGTAINDASSVVAAGYAYGHSAASYAIVVKLTRTTMIIPICAAILAARHRFGSGAAGAHTGDRSRPSLADERSATAHPSGAGFATTLRRAMPWFLGWFIAASAADTFGLLSASTKAFDSHAGLMLTTLALAAVGLSSDFASMRRTGSRPLVLGALVWGTVTITSLTLQLITGTL